MKTLNQPHGKPWLCVELYGCDSQFHQRNYDPVYGARPLKRAIQQEIENPLAQQILSGSLLTSSVVTVDYVDGKVVARQ